MEKDKVVKAIQELRKNEKRKFVQSVELLINLKSFDIKKDSVNTFVTLPHKIRDAKICAFLNTKSKIVDSITKSEFDKYSEKKSTKKLVKEYDFFISSASLMPLVAKTFGRYLGTAGKMPSPQLGIVTAETDEAIKSIMGVFDRVVKVKSKEPSLKFTIGKENMKDEEIADNVIKAFDTVTNALVKKRDNIRSVMLRLTMTKPIRLEF